MPLRACSGCGELIDIRGYWAHQDAERGTARERGYDEAWAARRAEHLAIEPWCRFHLERGQSVPATEVDHIITRRAGGSDEHDNLRSLCKPCHSRRTAIEQSGWGG